LIAIGFDDTLGVFIPEGWQMTPDELLQIKGGMAALTACAVGAFDSAYQERFLTNLDQAYNHLRDNRVGEGLHDLELLSWTRKMLRGG
jgi:hypothetical protein